MSVESRVTVAVKAQVSISLPLRLFDMTELGKIVESTKLILEQYMDADLLWEHPILDALMEVFNMIAIDGEKLNRFSGIIHYCYKHPDVLLIENIRSGRIRKYIRFFCG